MTMLWNLLRRAKRQVFRRMAAAYIPGPQLSDGIDLCRRIEEYGWCSTICPWDGPDDTPETVASSYQLALRSIVAENLDCYLSIKVPSLDYDFEILRGLLDIGREHRVRMHFDSQHPASASPSFRLLGAAAKTYPNLGCTLPSRWKRSISDAERVIELGIPVRVVKGQWADPDQPGLDPRAQFATLIDLLAGRAAEVAVATHDAALAKESLIRLQESGTPCQLEQLFGLPIRDENVAKPLGVKIRVYVPYGHAYLPYALSQVRKQPVILAWMARDLLLGAHKRIP